MKIIKRENANLKRDFDFKFGNQIYNVTNLNLTDNNSLFPVTGRLILII